MPKQPPAGLAAPPGPGCGTPVLPAEWLEETLDRARALLHRDDPFMQALERQREPMAEPGAWTAQASADAQGLESSEMPALSLR
jgi:hypothetical protein